MLDLAPTASTRVADLIRRHGGGGPRRIAENAGLVVTHGEGSYLVDDSGRRYLDLATAMGVAAIGHGNAHWADAVSAQSRRLAATVLHTPEHAHYLDALAGILPHGLDRIALYSGGAEAVEVAIRLAQSYTRRRHVVSFTTGFHGKTAATRFTGRRFADEQLWLGVDWVHAVAYPECREHDCETYATDCGDEGLDALAALDAKAASVEGGIAAVIVEPILGTAGNRPPQRRFIERLVERCQERGWLCILDESITGFGRLGRPFAAEWFGVTPDIMVLGKAMGGGYPLSAVAAGSELWDKSLFSELSATSSSYGANPVACAAGQAVVDIVGAPGFLDNVVSCGARMSSGLRALADASPYVRNPRGVGLMLGFDLVDPSTGALADAALSQRLFTAMLERGLLVAQVPAVRLNAPLTLSEAECDQALAALSGAVAA